MELLFVALADSLVVELLVLLLVRGTRFLVLVGSEPHLVKAVVDVLSCSLLVRLDLSR